MSPEQFLELTPLEFYYALKDNDDVRMLEARPVCEAIRMNAFWLFNIQADKRDKIRNPKKLMRFSWDEEKNKQPQTLEQMKQMAKAIANSNKKKK